jgi:hypothetical protein
MQLSAVVSCILATNFDASSLFCLLTMQSPTHQTTKMHPKIIHVTLHDLKRPDFKVGENHAFPPPLKRHF